MKKENNNLVIGVIIILLAVLIVIAFNSFLNKKKESIEEIKSVRVVDINLLNSVVAEQENHECLLCGAIGDCRSKSLKLSFQVDANTQSISCKVYNNEEPEGLGYSSAYSGMNVYPVFRDYSNSPQKYKVCCILTFSKSPSPVCSKEYKYANPC